MRRARYHRPCRGDRFLPRQCGRFRRGRPGRADRGGHRRRSQRRGLQGIRPDQGRGPAGKLEEFHQGAVPRQQYSDRGLRPFHRCRRGEGLYPRAGRADRGQGGRSRRRQGRRGGDDRRGSARGGRHDVRRRSWRGRRRSRGRGIHAGRGGLVLRAVRRRARAAAGHRAGPQARLRRRQGAEHRRHGRLFAGAGDDGGDLRAGDGRDDHADAARAERDGRRLTRACSMPA